MRKLLDDIIILNKKGLKKVIDEVNRTEFYSKNEISKYQNYKLIKLINHAYNNIPYYRNIFKELGLTPKDIKTVNDLQKLPILEKSDIQNNFNTLRFKGVNKFEQRITSGSTGKPLNILIDSSTKLIEMALVRRFNFRIGNTFDKKELLLWGRQPIVDFKYRIKLFIKELFYNYKQVDTYNLSDKLLKKLATQISEGKFSSLRGYTSSVHLMAKKIEELGLKADLVSISVTAEKLLDSKRFEIEKILGKNLYDQYGCGEINSLAFECDHHLGMHHAFEHSIMEIVDKNNLKSNSGDIIITNLDNYVMPLIRYRNGDLGAIDKEKCLCGRSSTRIKKINGRSYDIIKGSNGKIIHSGLLDEVLLDTKFNKNFNIGEIRLIQTGLKELTIEYVSDETVSEEAMLEVKEIYKKYFGSMKTIFNRVNKIEPTKAGKQKFVISYEEYCRMKNN